MKSNSYSAFMLIRTVFSRILSICITLAVAFESMSFHASATDSGDNLRVLLPYPIEWFSRAAELYEEETGTRIEIITTLDSKADLDVGVIDSDTPKGFSMSESKMRENLMRAIEEDKCDLVYTWGIPAELIADTRNLINIDSLLTADSSIDPTCYHAGAMNTRITDEGRFTIPVVFDFTLLAANIDLAKSVGIDAILHNGMTLKEYTSLCAAATTALKDDPVKYAVMDMLNSETLSSNMIPTAFVLEALSFYRNRGLDTVDEQFAKLILDYHDYYIATASSEKSASLSKYLQENVEYKYDTKGLSPDQYATRLANGTLSLISWNLSFTQLINDGQLLFYAPFYSELRDLNSTENISLYTYPTSQNSGFIYNMEGLSIVDNSRSTLSWDFLKFILSDDAQRLAAQAACPVSNNVRSEVITQSFADGSAVLNYVNNLTKLSVYRRPTYNPKFFSGLKLDCANNIGKIFSNSQGCSSTYGDIALEDYLYMMSKGVSDEYYPRSQLRPIAWYWYIPLYIFTGTLALLLVLQLFVAYRRNKSSGWETSRTNENGALQRIIIGRLGHRVFALLIAVAVILASVYIMVAEPNRFLKTCAVTAAVACLALITWAMLQKNQILQYKNVVYIFKRFHYYRVDNRSLMDVIPHGDNSWRIDLRGPVIVELSERSYPGVQGIIDDFMKIIEERKSHL